MWLFLSTSAAYPLKFLSFAFVFKCLLFGSSVTLSLVAQRMYPATERKKRRTILLHFPQALHTPAPEQRTALLRLTAQHLAASHWRGLTSSQQLLLSGVWKKSAGLSLHFKVGGEWLDRSWVHLVFVSSSHVSCIFLFLCFCPGCEELAAHFLSQEIDGQALLLLREDHLISTMNIKLGPALKICASINSLREWCSQRFRGETKVVFSLRTSHWIW